MKRALGDEVIVLVKPCDPLNSSVIDLKVVICLLIQACGSDKMRYNLVISGRDSHSHVTETDYFLTLGH